MGGIGDDADGRLAVELGSDRDPPSGMAVHVVGRAVDRIDDPTDAGGSGPVGSLFGQDPVVRTVEEDRFPR